MLISICGSLRSVLSVSIFVRGPFGLGAICFMDPACTDMLDLELKSTIFEWLTSKKNHCIARADFIFMRAYGLNYPYTHSLGYLFTSSWNFIFQGLLGTWRYFHRCEGSWIQIKNLIEWLTASSNCCITRAYMHLESRGPICGSFW